MTRTILLAAVAAPLLLAGTASAQIRPLPPTAGASAYDQHRWQADQHRYEMDRLRLQADQREATARQLELDARLARQQLDNRRSVDPYIPSQPPALRSPEEERTTREAATARRQAVDARVGEIDAWLDRRPN